MKIAVVGATGLVGQKMLQVLEERNFPVSELLAVASERSVGKTILFKNEKIEVIGMQEAIKRKPVIAIFSAGGDTSLEWAPQFAANDIIVIDNSSAWRMDSGKKLIIPEINAGVLTKEDRIIANPNCSTIQLLIAIAPLHRKYQLRRMIISTYQSVSGTGVKAVRQLEEESRGMEPDKAYPHQIFNNCLPHCDVFLDNGYTKEEMKMVNETHKILGDQDIKITATAVRVPVNNAHSESVNLEFEKDFDLAEVKDILSTSPGLVLLDEPTENIYPMAVDAFNKDEVFVGRLRQDYSCAKALNMWIVADNLRKGAATNAIQIAEHLIEAKLV